MGSLLKSQAVKKNCWHLAGMVQGFCLSEREKNPVNLGISSLFLPKSLSNSNPWAPSVLSINKQPSEGGTNPSCTTGDPPSPILSTPPPSPPCLRRLPRRQSRGKLAESPARISSCSVLFAFQIALARPRLRFGGFGPAILVLLLVFLTPRGDQPGVMPMGMRFSAQ